MKKNTKLLIGAALTAVLLAGALIVVLLIPSNNNKINVADNNDILLFDKTKLSVEEIAVDNAGGAYELLAYEYTESSVSSKADSSSSLPVIPAVNQESSGSGTNFVYTMQDYPEWKLDQNMTNDLSGQCRYMAARELIDKSGQRYNEYGLEKPRVSVRVRYSDATSVTMYLGNDAPDNKGVYLRMEGDKNVYLVQSSMVDTFFMEKLQLFDKHLTGKIDDVSRIRVTKSDGSEISIIQNGNAYYSAYYLMEQPTRSSCDNTKTDSIINSACNLQAIWVAAINVTEEDIKACGLDQPYETFELEGKDGSSIHLIASSADSEKKIYLMKPDDKIIFQTYAAQNLWYDVKRTSFLSDDILKIKADEIRKLVLKDSRDTNVYQLDKKKEMNDNYYETETITLIINGKPVPFTNFSVFISNLCQIARTVQAPKSTKDCTELLRAEFSYFNAADVTDTLVFYREKSGKTFIVINDNIECYVDSNYTDQLIAQIPLIPEKDLLPDLNSTETSS